MPRFRWNHLRGWVKVARELPRTRGGYPDGPIVALVFAFCRAAEQPEPGTFDSIPVLRAILDATGGKRGKWVPFLVEKGDVVVLPDGRAILPNWVEFQEEGTSTKRVREHRDRLRGNASETPMERDETLHVTPDETLAGAPARMDSLTRVRPSIDGRALAGLDGAPDDEPEFPILSWLATQDVTIPPNGNGFHRRVIELVRRYGAERVREAMAGAMAAGARGDRAVVFGAENLLDRIPDGRTGGKPKGHQPEMSEVDRAFGA